MLMPSVIPARVNLETTLFVILLIRNPEQVLKYDFYFYLQPSYLRDNNV